MTWTAQQSERLTELWAQGLSCSQIARVLGNGISRCAVIGRARRLKLPSRVELPRPKSTYHREPVVRTQPLAVIKASPPSPAIFLCEPATFAEGDTCRFITGDPTGPDWKMCGQPGHPWCGYHRSVCYNAPRTADSQKANLDYQQDRNMRRVGLG